METPAHLINQGFNRPLGRFYSLEAELMETNGTALSASTKLGRFYSLEAELMETILLDTITTKFFRSLLFFRSGINGNIIL